ncbi:MAG TPA: hypothetical protein VGM46_01100 [Mesorhizobium sp.]|jgi:hypothetical protein
MNIKMLCMGAMALSMISGAALAGGGSGTSALDDAAMMAPFYTDSSMKTMRGDDEFKAAWLALNKKDQDDMMSQCKTNTDKQHNDFCANAMKLGGANGAGSGG